VRSATIARLVLGLAAVAALAGCGGSPATSSASPSPSSKSAVHISNVDACSLVTTDQAVAAFGGTFQSSGGSGICTYASTDGTTSMLLFANVLQDENAANSVKPEQLASSYNGAYGISNAKTLSGAGYKAVEYTLTSGGEAGTMVFIFKANVVLMMVVQPAPKDTTKLEVLVKIAADGLHA
jgi:hypothetical protein